MPHEGTTAADGDGLDDTTQVEEEAAVLGAAGILTKCCDGRVSHGRRIGTACRHIPVCGKIITFLFIRESLQLWAGCARNGDGKTMGGYCKKKIHPH